MDGCGEDDAEDHDNEDSADSPFELDDRLPNSDAMPSLFFSKDESPSPLSPPRREGR